MENIISPQDKQKLNVICGLVIILFVIIIILAVMAVLSDNDDDDDNEEEHTGPQAYVDLLVIHVSDELVENQQVVQSMAATPDIVPAFTNGSTEDIDNANAVLDAYQDTFNVTVCYLMNETGVTIASSNRDSPSSFVGKNYSFRPYFQHAIAGNLGHYFALGITSGTRGYYSGFPVKDENGTIVGVAVIKKELDYLEDAFSSEGLSFLVSPKGIIFLSSEPDLLMRGFWELNQTTKDDLIASRQFGDGPFDALLDNEPTNGDEVEYDGKDFKVYRKPVHEEGWSIVLLSAEHDEDNDEDVDGDDD